jgi:hypothetical protein
MLFPAGIIAALLLLSPPLMMLVLCVPFGGLLWFPAWAAAISSRGGGFEVAGQRLAYGVMFLLILAVALLPAGLAGGALWTIGALLGWPIAGQVLGALAATAVVAVEAVYAVRGIGHRIEHFDLSVELR